jgi:hypothetical protein
MNKETLTVERDSKGTVTYCNSKGDLHNPYGPAVIRADGYTAYYINGQIHNENGPAIIGADGYKVYYINDKRHNPHGPAIIGADGYKAYWINGKELTEAEFTGVAGKAIR